MSCRLPHTPWLLSNLNFSNPPRVLVGGRKTKTKPINHEKNERCYNEENNAIVCRSNRSLGGCRSPSSYGWLPASPEPTENDDCKGDASCIGFCEGYDYSGPCANCRISEGLVCYMYSPTTYVTKTTYRGNCEIAYGTNLCHCDFDVKTSPNLGTITIACRCNP